MLNSGEAMKLGRPTHTLDSTIKNKTPALGVLMDIQMNIVLG
jgi:hypothetical protein